MTCRLALTVCGRFFSVCVLVESVTCGCALTVTVCGGLFFVYSRRVSDLWMCVDGDCVWKFVFCVFS